MTKIVATIGPASEDHETLPKCILAGMRVMRVNFSHATFEEVEMRLKNLPLGQAPENKTTGSPTNLRAVLLDTQGPEIRLGGLAVCKGKQVPSENRKKKVELIVGNELILTTDKSVDGNGDAGKMYVNYPKLAQVVNTSTKILLDDGIVGLEVTEVIDGTSVRTVVRNSNPLGERKSVCLPGTKTDLPPMSEKDKKDIRYGVERDMDFIAASFVRTPGDVEAVRAYAAKCQKESSNPNGRPPLVISKVETLEAMENWSSILDVSDGIMVARGDLGVEMDLEEVILAQKMMVAECNAVGKPVIVATQMLDSMAGNPRPTRAEVADVTNAVHDGADAVMLSGESANGQFPVETIATMNGIIQKCETSKLYPLALSAGAQRAPKVVDELDSKAKEAVAAATAAGASCIAVEGPIVAIMAQRLAKFRPTMPILARVTEAKEGRQLMLNRGVHPVIEHSSMTTADLAAQLGFTSAHVISV